MKIVVIALAVVLTLLGGGGAAVWFFAPQYLPAFIRPADSADSKVTAHRKEPEVGADLDVFVVNLAAPETSRYLRTTLSLGVRDQHDKEKIKELTGPIRHAVIMYLSKRRTEELLDPEGKNRIRAELNKEINHAIGEKLVLNVYFKEFLIQ
ncbi:MAG TPA: flagellar basal body-associated FliL family protein [candidate division Zixibacteria bacterium]|nr:flagellar basal body-associated FliL family protein [candidate division Zixibacteria bacterium]